MYNLMLFSAYIVLSILKIPLVVIKNTEQIRTLTRRGPFRLG